LKHLSLFISDVRQRYFVSIGDILSPWRQTETKKTKKTFGDIWRQKRHLETNGDKKDIGDKNAKK